MPRSIKTTPMRVVSEGSRRTVNKENAGQVLRLQRALTLGADGVFMYKRQHGAHRYSERCFAPAWSETLRTD